MPLAVACAVLWPVLLLGSAPFRHDWIWPTTAAAVDHLTQFGFSEWSPQNLGSRNVYPALAPLLAVEWLFCKVAGPRFGLDALLIFGAVIGVSGARHVATQTGLRLWHARAAAAIYLAVPAFSSELIAGHVGDLVAFAALPWVVYSGFVYAETGRTRFIGLGALSALAAAVQVQYIVLIIIVAAGVAVCSGRRRSFWWVAVIAVLVLIGNAPTTFGVLATRADIALINHERAIIQWEIAQSAPFRLAAHGAGYTANYDVTFLNRLGVFAPAAQAVLDYSPVSVVALFVISNRRVGVMLAGLYGFGLVMISGFHGPLEPVLRILFVDVKAMSLVRELFHGAPMVALPLALAIPAYFQALEPQAGGAVLRKWPWQRAALVVVVIAFLAGPASGAAQPWLSVLRLDAKFETALRKDAADSTPGRVAIFPARMPEVDLESGATGVDSLSYFPNGSHWSMFDYYPAGIEALASDFLNVNDIADAEALYARMSVRRVIFRSNVEFARDSVYTSAARVELRHPRQASPHSDTIDHVINARPLVYGAQIPLLIAGDFQRLLDPRLSERAIAFARQSPSFIASGLPYQMEALDSADLQIAQGCAAIRGIVPSRISASPRNAWVDAYRFGITDPAADFALQDAVLTQDESTLKAADFASQSALVATLVGGFGEHFDWRLPPATVAPGSAVAIAGILVPTGRACAPLHPSIENGSISNVDLSSHATTMLSGTFLSDGDGTLGFTDAFDSNWQLAVDGIPQPAAAHFKLDGFANGWILRLPKGRHSFSLTFDSPQRWLLLQILECTAWIVSIVLLISPDPRRGPIL